MAGRSSANSAFPAVRGQPSGTTSMARSAGVQRLMTTEPQRAWRLVNESLETAVGEYAELGRRIRSRAALLRRPPPSMLLLWFSECELAAGCAHLHRVNIIACRFSASGLGEFLHAASRLSHVDLSGSSSVPAAELCEWMSARHETGAEQGGGRAPVKTITLLRCGNGEDAASVSRHALALPPHPDGREAPNVIGSPGDEAERETLFTLILRERHDAGDDPIMRDALHH